MLQMVSEPDNICYEDIEPQRKWIVRSHIGWQLLSKPDIGQCANQDVEPPMGWIVRYYISWKMVLEPDIKWHVNEDTKGDEL